MWASVKMGWQDKRLLAPSICIVFTNMLFGFILFLDGLKQMSHQAGKVGGALQPGAAAHHAGQMISAPTNGIFGGAPSAGTLMNGVGVNGITDTNGFGFNWETIQPLFTTDNVIIMTSLMSIWWLTNRFLEGVTTAMVYSHLTEGRGSGKFFEACNAVFQSLPAIIMLGIATFIAKKLASFMKNKTHSGLMGFLSNIVEVFWTLAGHLILPAIVIEGCSFFGGLKRADKIAQSSLLTIGVGEVGVDLLCRVATYGLWALGGSAASGVIYLNSQYALGTALIAPVAIAAVLWGISLILVTALSIYIRSAFYTCLYVWAIEIEDMEETERSKVKAPGPLAAALA